MKGRIALMLVLTVVSLLSAQIVGQEYAQGQQQEKKACPTCGTLAPVDAKFCSKCGYEFPKIVEQQLEKKACGSCGTLVPVDTKFCPKCGYEFPKAKEELLKEQELELKERELQSRKEETRAKSTLYYACAGCLGLVLVVGVLLLVPWE